MTRVTVIGADGRMGRLVVQAIHGTEGIELVGAVEANEAIIGQLVPGSEEDIIFISPEDYPSMENVFQESDAIIDVSSTEGIRERISLASKFGKALVIGTTGLSSADELCLRGLAEHIPCVLTANFSVGGNSMFKLVAEMAAILGPGYDVEIVEAHHKLKKDAPSGTATRLAKIVAAVRGWRLIDVACYGRQGIIGARPENQIGIHALRMGDVVGEHTVIFSGPGERIELTHRVGSRVAFAEGAVRAAKGVVGMKPGLHDMQDILGLR